MTEASGLSFWLFGKLHWAVLVHPSLIANAAAGLVVVGALGTLAVITWMRAWGYLWRHWLTTLDHKKIGAMYVITALVMLSRAIVEAMLMRTQQAAAVNAPGVVSPDHFAQLFSTHGTIMIFFMAMPFLTGLINWVMPQQIGARDVAFPFLNAVSLWLTVAAAILMMVSLVVGEFSTGGWSGYPPFTELAYNPGVGPDYWIWAITLSSVGSTLTGINFAVTIYKLRAPGMKMMAMPLFTWTSLCTSILMVFAMPPLTVATAMLALDRYAGFHFFTNAAGGNMMNYANLFWLFGHPEVYILILPAFGIYSELVSTFAGKRLYGYGSLVLATMAIAVLSFTVWLHHFFTMGQDADLNAAFGIATMLIGIPTGVKVYDWMLTLFRGRIRLTAPMLFALAFMFYFVIGGMSGILLANPPVDFQVHNSLFLVAHFHNMLIPGLLYGMIAGYMYWFPKAFGFRLHEAWGKAVFWLLAAGFPLAFFPLYWLGLEGAPRRMHEFFDPAFRLPLYIALAGGGLMLAGVGALIVQLFVSIRRRDTLAVPGGDPWDGRSLEWWGPAPPPEYNFFFVPDAPTRDAFMAMKSAGEQYARPDRYEDVEVACNSMIPLAIGVAGGVLAFALTWHVWWLAAAGLLGAIGSVIARSFVDETERTIPAAEVRAAHERWLEQVESLPTCGRIAETTTANKGRPDNEIAVLFEPCTVMETPYD